MATDVEAKSPIFDGSRQPANISGICFKNFRLKTVAGEFVASRQAGGPGSDNDNSMVDIQSFNYTQLE